MSNNESTATQTEKQSLTYTYRKNEDEVAFAYYRGAEEDIICPTCTDTPHDREFPLYADNLEEMRCLEPLRCVKCDKELVPSLAATQEVSQSRTPEYDSLRLHLLSRHCNGAALGLDDTEAQEDHEKEHKGPCTVRNHPRESVEWNEKDVIEVLMECAEGDGLVEIVKAAEPAAVQESKQIRPRYYDLPESKWTDAEKEESYRFCQQPTPINGHICGVSERIHRIQGINHAFVTERSAEQAGQPEVERTDPSVTFLGFQEWLASYLAIVDINTDTLNCYDEDSMMDAYQAGASAKELEMASVGRPHLTEALRQILGWRELRSFANEVPIIRIEEIARQALAAQPPIAPDALVRLRAKAFRIGNDPAVWLRHVIDEFNAPGEQAVPTEEALFYSGASAERQAPTLDEIAEQATPVAEDAFRESLALGDWRCVCGWQGRATRRVCDHLIRYICPQCGASEGEGLVQSVAEGEAEKAALLPCPFCGLPVDVGCDPISKLFAVACTRGSCYCQPHASYRETREQAIAVWNTRASINPASLSAERCAEILRTIKWNDVADWIPAVNGQIVASPSRQRLPDEIVPVPCDYVLADAQVIAAYYLEHGGLVREGEGK